VDSLVSCQYARSARRFLTNQRNLAVFEKEGINEMIFFEKVEAGKELPPWKGVVKFDYFNNTLLCTYIPFNLVCKWIYSTYARMLYWLKAPGITWIDTLVNHKFEVGYNLGKTHGKEEMKKEMISIARQICKDEKIEIQLEDTLGRVQDE